MFPAKTGACRQEQDAASVYTYSDRIRDINRLQTAYLAHAPVFEEAEEVG